jgi:6-phosphogluconolactonase
MNSLRTSSATALFLLALVTLAPCIGVTAERETFAYVASRTNGIVRYRVDSKTGVLSDSFVAAAAANPQFFALHPSQPFLYAINTALVNGKKTSVISAFTIDKKSGNLILLNHQPAAGGPTHLVVDHDGKNVLVANYGGGSVSIFPINADNSLAASSAFLQHKGSSVTPQRQ